MQDQMNPLEKRRIVEHARLELAKAQDMLRHKEEVQRLADLKRRQLTAAVLELSRIDDEALSKRDLRHAMKTRESKAPKTSFGSRGPSYSDSNLLERLSTAASSTLTTSCRAPGWFTGTGTNLLVEPRSSIKPVRTQQRERTTRNTGGPDPMTTISSLKKELKNAPDPNYLHFLIGQQLVKVLGSFGKTQAPPRPSVTGPSLQSTTLGQGSLVSSSSASSWTAMPSPALAAHPTSPQPRRSMARSSKDSSIRGGALAAQEEAEAALVRSRRLTLLTETRQCLESATKQTDAEQVLERRITKEEQLVEKRKLQRLDKESKAKYLKEKQYQRAQDILAEREAQRLRRLEAHRELWRIELDESCEQRAVEHMQQYLDLVVGQEERLAALAALHEDMSMDEDLKSTPGGVLEVFHCEVLLELQRWHPNEPHLAYALARLYGRREEPNLQQQSRRLMLNFVQTSTNHQQLLKAVPANKSEDYYFEKSIAKTFPRLQLEPSSHWKVVSDGAPTEAVTTFQAPPGGWIDRDTYTSASTRRPGKFSNIQRGWDRARQLPEPHVLGGLRSTSRGGLRTSERRHRREDPGGAVMSIPAWGVPNGLQLREVSSDGESRKREASLSM